MINNKDEYRVSYAQNREDVILAAFFENIKKGFYVDIGANDPDRESVTKYFYERGWSGINVEPQSSHFKNLNKKRKRDINLNIGVGAKKGTLNLRQYKGDGLSTFSPEVQEEYVSHPSSVTATYIDTPITISTLSGIFQEYNVDHIEFLKVDVEGLEYDVLQGNNWNKWRPQVICIEANHIKKDWHALLQANDYELSFFDGLNEYFTDSHNPETMKNFSYVESILFGKPVIPYSIAKLIDKERELSKSLKIENEAGTQERQRLQEELKRANDYILYLQNELNEIISLKAHVKKFIKKRAYAINENIEAKLQSLREFSPIRPVIRGNLLDAAYKADVQNLQNYNQVFTENQRIKIYRKAKHITKRVIEHGKKRL